MIFYKNNEQKIVFIVGLGLIGGSLALALRDIQDIEIIGYDTSSPTLKHAINSKMISYAPASIAEGAKISNFIVICVPIDSMEEVIREIGKSVGQDVFITDTCSVKKKIVMITEELLPYPENFVGAHPMAGSEQAGIFSASNSLFLNRPFFLTPTKKTDPLAFSQVSWLFKKTGARLIALTPEEHDTIVAFNSHLPHAIAWSLISSTKNYTDWKEAAAAFSGGSFRDATRVALSSPELWKNILLNNKKNLLFAIESFLNELKHLSKLIEKEETNSISAYINEARETRMRISLPDQLGEELYELQVIIENKPGELAKVTTILGKAQVNIENIEIIHGDGQGTLMIGVKGIEATKRGKEALAKERFEVSYRVKISEE